MRLDLFDASENFDRGRPTWFEAVWYLVKIVFFLSGLPWPSSLKCALLRAFGAKIGDGVVIKPRVNIHFPWRLEVGAHSWIGEEVFILNLEPVRIGTHVCISQRAFLCTGNHDFASVNFAYRNEPIFISDGAWIGASVFVGPGVNIGSESVVLAGSAAVKSLPTSMICRGNPAVVRSPRWKAVTGR